MWTCPNCKQTIPELLTVKENKEVAQKYITEFNEYCARMEEHNVKEEEFERRVKEHNKNKKWWQRSWYICTNWLFVSIRAYPLDKCIDIVSIPQKPSQLKYKYLQCTQCGYKEYIN